MKSRIVTNQEEIEQLKEDRQPNIFTLPEHRKDEKFALDPHKDYTVSQPVSFRWRSVLWARNMLIDVLASTHDGMNVALKNKIHNNSRDFNTDNVKKSKSSFKIGKVGVCEHTAALINGMGLHANFIVSVNNFPNFNEGIYKILSEIAPVLVEKWESKLMTVKEPIAIRFGKKWYFMLEPDQGEHKLIVDHQFSHKNHLGDQRIEIEITPEVFAHIASARPPAYGFRAAVSRKLKLFKIKRLPFLWLDAKNVVFVNKKNIWNPNPAFDDEEWINREVLLHEVIDKLGALGILPGRFVGRVTTFYTNHKKDVEAMKTVYKELIECK